MDFEINILGVKWHPSFTIRIRHIAGKWYGVSFATTLPDHFCNVCGDWHHTWDCTEEPFIADQVWVDQAVHVAYQNKFEVKYNGVPSNNPEPIVTSKDTLTDFLFQVASLYADAKQIKV